MVHLRRVTRAGGRESRGLGGRAWVLGDRGAWDRTWISGFREYNSPGIGDEHQLAGQLPVVVQQVVAVHVQVGHVGFRSVRCRQAGSGRRGMQAVHQGCPRQIMRSRSQRQESMAARTGMT